MKVKLIYPNTFESFYYTDLERFLEMVNDDSTHFFLMADYIIAVDL